MTVSNISSVFVFSIIVNYPLCNYWYKIELLCCTRVDHDISGWGRILLGVVFTLIGTT
jgi:hypothetical protein